MEQVDIILSQILDGDIQLGLIDELFHRSWTVGPGKYVLDRPNILEQYNKAAQYFDNSDYETAAVLFRELNNSLPNRPTAITTSRISETLCWLKIGKYNDYIEFYAPLHKANPVVGPALWGLAQAYYLKHQIGKSQECIEEWIDNPQEQHPERGHFLLCLLNLQSNDTENARQNLQMALNKNSNLIQRYIAEVEASVKKTDLQQVATCKDPDPGTTDSTLQQNISLTSTEQQNDIADKTPHISSSQTNQQSVKSVLQNILIPRPPSRYAQLMQSSNWLKMRSEYSKSLERYSDGDIEESINLIKQLLSKGFDSTPLEWALIDCMVANGDYQNATEKAQSHLENNSTPAAVYWNVACAYYYLGEYGSAFTVSSCFTKKEYSNNAKAWMVSGLLAYLASQNNEAEERLLKASQISGDFLIKYKDVLNHIWPESSSFLVENNSIPKYSHNTVPPLNPESRVYKDMVHGCRDLHQMVSFYSSYKGSSEERCTLFLDVLHAREVEYECNQTNAENIYSLALAHSFYGKAMSRQGKIEEGYLNLEKATLLMDSLPVRPYQIYHGYRSIALAYRHELLDYHRAYDTYQTLMHYKNVFPLRGWDAKLTKIEDDMKNLSKYISSLPEEVTWLNRRFSASDADAYYNLLPKIADAVMSLQKQPDNLLPELINRLYNIALEHKSNGDGYELPAITAQLKDIRDKQIDNIVPLYRGALLNAFQNLRNCIDYLEQQFKKPRVNLELETGSYFIPGDICVNVIAKIANVGLAGLTIYRIQVQNPMQDKWNSYSNDLELSLPSGDILYISLPINFINKIYQECSIDIRVVIEYASLPRQLNPESYSQDVIINISKFMDVDAIYDHNALQPRVDGPDNLYGREELLGRLSNGVRQNRFRPFIQGVRKVGKTSILHFLKKQITSDSNNKFMVVFVTLDGSWTNIFFKLSRQIQGEFRKRGIGTDIPIAKDADEFAELLYECQEAGIERIILMLDEFHGLIDRINKGTVDSGCLGDLRNFYTDSQYGLGVVFADWHTSDELANKVPAQIWADLRSEKVTFLDKPDAQNAILAPLEKTKVIIPSEIVDYIYKLTAGYPWHIQIICSDLIDILNKHRRYFVTNYDIEAVIQRFIEQDTYFEEGICRQERIGHIEQDVMYLILDLLNDHRTSRDRMLKHCNSIGQCGDVIQGLVDNEVFITDSDGQLGFCSLLVEEWVRRKNVQGENICANLRPEKISAPEYEGYDKDSRKPDDDSNNSQSSIVVDEIRNIKHQLRQLLIGKNSLEDKNIFENQDNPVELNKARKTVRTPDDWDSFIDGLNSILNRDLKLDMRTGNKKIRVPFKDLASALYILRQLRNYKSHSMPELGEEERWAKSKKIFEERCMGAIGQKLPTTEEQWSTLQLSCLEMVKAALVSARDAKNIDH